MFPPAQAAEKSPALFSPRELRRRGKRASIQLTWLDPGLALRTPPRKKRRPSQPHEGCSVMTPFQRLEPEDSTS